MKKKNTAISSSPGSVETINRRTYVRFEIELTTYQFEDITTIYLEGRETILKIPDIVEYFMPV